MKRRVSATDPERHPEAGAAAARRRVPTRGSLRKFIAAVVIGDSDLDAFCGDHYQAEVRSRFTLGMDRVQQVTLLLDHADRTDIVEKLHKAFPNKTKDHEHLLEWEPWPPPPPPPPSPSPPSPPPPPPTDYRAFSAITAVAAIVATAGFTWWALWRAPVPDVAPFDPAAPGIVLGGPWLATDGEKLCADLKDLDPQRAVQCLAFPLRGSAAETLRDKAREAGAAVVVTVTGTGVAVAVPLRPTESSALLGDKIVVDVQHEPDRKRAAILMNALMLLSAPRPEFPPDLIPCPAMGQGPLDRNSLLTLVVVPSCEAVRLDPRQYEAACGAATPDADETCALARYLEAEAFRDTPRARPLLEKLRDRGPKRLQDAAKLKLVRADCKDGKAEDAERAIRELAKGASGCDEVLLVEPAACVVARQHGRGSAELLRIEALPVASNAYSACSPTMRAKALAGRAHWRESVGRWAEASIDNERAYNLHGAPLYGLAQAETLLLQRRTAEALNVLQDLHQDAIHRDRSLHVYATLLRWAASRQGDDAFAWRSADQAVCALHDGKEPVLTGPKDVDLHRLLCAEGQPSCLYDALQSPSSNELRSSLRCP